MFNFGRWFKAERNTSMRRVNRYAALYGGCLLAFAGTCSAQFGRGAASWATTGADAQRSSWVRNDPKISKEELQKPEFRFLWKLKLSDRPGQINTLTPAVLLTKYIGYRGFRDLALVQSNSESVYGIDVDLGRIEWNAHLKPATSSAAASSCEAGIMAGLARPGVTAFPGTANAFGPGRGGPAHSGVGDPGEGAITLAQAGSLTFHPPPTPPPAAPTVPATGTQGASNAPAAPGSGGPFPVPRHQPIVINTLGG